MALEHLDNAGHDAAMKAGETASLLVGNGTPGKGVIGGIGAWLDNMTASARGDAANFLGDVAGGINNGIDRIANAPSAISSGLANMKSSSSSIESPAKGLGVEKEAVATQGVAQKEFSSIDSQLKQAGLSKSISEPESISFETGDNFQCKAGLHCNIEQNTQVGIG